MIKRKRPKLYPHVIPDIKEWPIYKLHQDRRNFIREIDEFTLERLLKKYGGRISDLIAKTIYLEQIRIKEEPWKVDPPDERQFWKKVQNRLVVKSLDREEEEARATNEMLLRRILHRYSEEIVGTFSIKTFRFARRFLTFFFKRLLNAAASRNFRRLYTSRHQLYERLVARGELDTVRSLINKGTVVVLPTHFSNLDSILVGYVMDEVLGLPSFSYGAGLNLYNTGYTAYFMNRLGAYRVDRRKKNPIYLEVLKSMSNLSLQRGTNSLFFPGGTRSRSGSLETHLKMGLLGTVVEAQRAMYESGKDQKIFIVPVVLGYHVVLEARYLIDQHLRRTGKERYFRQRDFGFSIRKILKFAWKVFSQPSEITLAFGKPLDVLGNFVDENGVSHDSKGQVVEVKDYFLSAEGVEADLQREAEYTKILADRVVERYFRENVVLSSHLVAFAAFNLLRIQNPSLDLYAVLRLPTDDHFFTREDMETAISHLQAELKQREERGEIRLAKQISWEPAELIRDGLKHLGVYHPAKVLKINKEGHFVSEDFHLLYFYHNRLDHYELEKVMQAPVPMVDPHWNNIDEIID